VVCWDEKYREMNPKIARSGRKEERSRRASMMTRTGRGGR